MTARAPVYIDSGKLHVFENGDTLPPWLSPSSMAWENLTGVPAGITQLADLTGPGYAKVDAAGAWSVQAAIPQADVSGLATALAGLQPISARLTAIAGLTDAAGWLHDDGSGAWSISVPTASQVGAEAALGSPAASGYLLSSTSAGGRSWVAPYSLPTATASVLGGVKVGTGLAISSGALSVSYGTAAGTACVGNDSRLSDSRAPTAHALDGALHTISGKTAGQVLVATGATTFGFATISGDATLSGAGALTLASLLTAGSAGGATSVPTLTWDAKGRLTAVSSVAISIPHTQINDWAASVSSVYLPLAGGTMTGSLLGGASTDIGSTTAWLRNGFFTSLYVGNAAVLTANQSISLTGAVTGSGTTSIATSFANTHLSGINQDLTTTSSPTFGMVYGNLTGTASNASALGGVAADYFVQGSNASRTTQLTASGTSQSQLFKSGFYDSTNWTDINSSWIHMIHCAMSNEAGATNIWSFDIAANFAGSTNNGEHYYVRTIANGASLNWRELIHSSNVGSYAIPLTGSSAITGALTSSNSSNIGSTSSNWGTVYATSVMSTGTESISSFALSGDVLTLSHSNGDLTWVNTIRGSAAGLVLQNAIISGTFSPEVNLQSSPYTITRADQGKMVISIYTLNLPSLTDHDAGFWCLVNWHVGGGSAVFGPTTSGTTWILRGQYVHVSTSTPFTGVVSWDGYTWYAG